MCPVCGKPVEAAAKHPNAVVYHMACVKALMPKYNPKGERKR